MVATTEDGQPKEKPNKEVDEANEAKEAADPAVDDPSYMPSIVPQTGDGGTASKKEVEDPGSEPNPDNPVNSPQATNPRPAKTGADNEEN